MNNGLQGPWNEGLLQNMTKLVDLGLRDNRFNISLPLDIAEVKSLNTLTLAGNNLTGAIPKEYGKLHRLGEYTSACTDGEISMYIFYVPRSRLCVLSVAVLVLLYLRFLFISLLRDAGITFKFTHWNDTLRTVFP